MAVGCSTLNNEENTNNPRPFNSPKLLPRNDPAAQYLQVARPFNSPRLLCQKRPIEALSVDLSFELPCLHLQSAERPAKQPKLEVQHCPSMPAEEPELVLEQRVQQAELELQHNMEILGEILPETPKARCTTAVTLTPEKFPSLRGPKTNRALEEAVEVAMRLFREAITAYVLEKDLRGEDEADKSAELWSADHYEELKSAILGLLPWTGELKASTCGSYDLVKFKGLKTKRLEVSKRQLQHFRAEGAQARAWEALCAVLAAISSRKEKIWLEYHEVFGELKAMLKKLPLCKTKKSARRRAAIREAIPGLVAEGAGGFAVSLIDPRGEHCVTFARGPTGPLPATSMTIRRMPLWDALKTMDDDGPLRGKAMKKEWCFAAGRQFALQDLQFGEEEQKKGSRKERKFAKQLQADNQIRDLLRSKKPVVVLDTLAALAPRDVCKSNSLSKIVTAELATLLREAKARGEAVVFCMGSDNPHKLAERVYLRAPLADYGMRCGCLRWRESAETSWAREFKWDDRITLCLQMP